MPVCHEEIMNFKNLRHNQYLESFSFLAHQTNVSGQNKLSSPSASRQKAIFS